LPGFAGFALTGFGGVADFARLDGVPALAGLAAADRFAGGVPAVCFVILPDGWLRRFVGIGCSNVWRLPCHRMRVWGANLANWQARGQAAEPETAQRVRTLGYSTLVLASSMRLYSSLEDSP
jgi:hypothetical protein